MSWPPTTSSLHVCRHPPPVPQIEADKYRVLAAARDDAHYRHEEAVRRLREAHAQNIEVRPGGGGLGGGEAGGGVRWGRVHTPRAEAVLRIGIWGLL